MPKQGAGTKKRREIIGAGKPATIEVEIIAGVNIHDEDTLHDALQVVSNAQEQLKEIEKFITTAKAQATTYVNSHAMKLVQVEDSYWRRIVRTSKFLVPTDDDIPADAPSGLKSLKKLCQGKTAKSGKKVIPLWNFITKRIVDGEKLDIAVAKGFITEKEIGKAYMERDGNPFLQKFAGVATEGEDDE